MATNYWQRSIAYCTIPHSCMLPLVFLLDFAQYKLGNLNPNRIDSVVRNGHLSIYVDKEGTRNNESRTMLLIWCDFPLVTLIGKETLDSTDDWMTLTWRHIHC